VEPSARHTPAGALLADIRVRLAEVECAIRSHRFLDAVDARAVPEARLRALAGEQWRTVASDRRAFAMLASRFPTHVAGDLFLSMAEGEGEALSLLRSYAAWLALAEDDLDGYEPRAGCQAYTAFVAWLGLNGSRADVALAFAANLAAWGENCGRLARGLRQRYGAPEEASPSSTSSPPRQTASIESWRSWRRGSRPATRRRAPGVRRGCCRRTSSCSGMRSRSPNCPIPRARAANSGWGGPVAGGGTHAADAATLSVARVALWS
jgi:TENA/THI-4/PQQC family